MKQKCLLLLTMLKRIAPQNFYQVYAHVYIAGRFRGLKLSQIGENLAFCGENFGRSGQCCEIHKHFHLQKLPAMLYDNIVVCIVLVLHLLNAQLTNLELF